jgi:hypothetical protein
MAVVEAVVEVLEMQVNKLDDKKIDLFESVYNLVMKLDYSNFERSYSVVKKYCFLVADVVVVDVMMIMMVDAKLQKKLFLVLILVHL